MKIAVIGGASSYTPELVEGLLSRPDRLPVETLALMDTDATRLDVVAGLAGRMAKRAGGAVSIRATTHLNEALADATFVVTQIRVGGMQARIGDERLGRRHGLIGQETTGIGGFVCALRTIPRVLDVARGMERHCPEAMLLNFTNPAGIVTEAMIRHGGVRSIGLCNIPIGIEMEVARAFGCDHSDVELDYVGLNHLSWVTGVRIAGTDRSEEVLDRLIAQASEEWEDPAVCEAMQTAMRSLGAYCNPYLQYFYAPEARLERQGRDAQTRGEAVLEIEARLFEQYADPDVDTKPAELSKRGGAHYSTAALALMDAVCNDTGARQIVCCRNGGAIPCVDADASVEAPARISRAGARPRPQTSPKPAIRGLMQGVKAYETLTVEAAVTGDREVALQALLVHPLMPGAQACRALLDDVLETNAEYLQGTFFQEAVGAT